MNPHELRAERHDVFMQAEALIASAKKSGKDLTPDQLAQHNRSIDRIKELDSLIARCEQVGAAANWRNRPTPIPALGTEPLTAFDTNNTGLKSHLRELYNRATMEQREQIDGIAAYLSGHIAAAANLNPGSDGGYLIPSFVVPTMERDYAAFNPVASVGRLWGTDTGADTVFPVLSDSEAAVQLDAAAATGADDIVSGDTPPTSLTGPTLKAYKVSSKPVFINREIFTDSAVDIVSEVLGALLARVIRFENLKRTKGTGVGESEGFLTNATKYVTGAVPLDLDICLDLAYSVPALYRPQGTFMMSDTTAKYLRKLKTGITGDKRQLWADADATKGTPATLHGYPVVVNNDMDSVAADGTFTGKNPLAFGDFSKFVIRQAENNQPFIYRYSVPAKDGSAVILFRRSDSKLIVPSAISKVSVS